MAQYRTKSIQVIQQLQTLQQDCSKIPLDIGKALFAVATEFKQISSALEYVASNLHNKNMQTADRLYRQAWFKISQITSARQAWSETELTKWLNANTTTGAIKNLAEKFLTGSVLLKDVWKYLDRINPVIEVAEAIHRITMETVCKVEIPSENLDRCTTIRNDLRQGLSQFSAVMDLVETINNFAPAGMKEYISYNLAVFEHAKKAFLLADQFASTLAALTRETENLWDKAINNRYSIYNATASIEQGIAVERYIEQIDREEKRDSERNSVRRNRARMQRRRH